MLDVKQIEQVLSQLDTPVWLVTTADGERRGGFIATTVTSVSIVRELPRLLITINKRHHTYPLIQASRAMAVHLIDENQLDLIWRFGLQSGRDVDKFEGLTFQTAATGSPILSEAVAWLDCRVEATMDTGDRAIDLLAVADGQRQRSVPILTTARLFGIAPPDKKKIMSEQYEHDACLDAQAIRQWRAGRAGK